MNDIVSLIVKELDSLVKTEDEISKRIKLVKRAYEVIGPHKGKFVVNNALNFLQKPNVLKDCLDVVFIDENFDYEMAIKVIKALKDYYEYQDEVKRINKSFLNYEKGDLLSLEFVKEAIMRSGNNVLKQEYLSMVKRQKKMDEAYEVEVKSLYYTCSKIIFDYEYLSNKRSDVKAKIKTFKSILKKVSDDSSFTPKEISEVITLINVKKMDDSQRLVGILNGYLSKFTSKDKKEKQKDVHEDVKQEIIYVDNESQKKVISPVYMNYLKVIKSFDSFNDVGIFLDSLRYNEDLIPTIEKMINLLSDTKEDELLKSYLETYVINMTNNSANNDNDVLKDEVKDDVLIMYYDFYEGKNRVLSDIKGKISPEYYEDVLRAINQIKKNGGIGKRKRLDCVKKAFRIRVNDIRVTYRQTSEKVYVILGVFCKKDNKGYDIINTSSKRNSDFNLKEPFIDKMLKIKEGKQMINDKNKKFEQDIISLLNSKVNNKKGK